MKTNLDELLNTYPILGMRADLIRAREVKDTTAIEQHTRVAEATAVLKERNDLARRLSTAVDEAEVLLRATWQDVSSTATQVQDAAEALSLARRAAVSSEQWYGKPGSGLGMLGGDIGLGSPAFLTDAHEALENGWHSRITLTAGWARKWIAKSYAGEPAPLAAAELRELAEPVLRAQRVLEEYEANPKTSEVMPETIEIYRATLAEVA